MQRQSARQVLSIVDGLVKLRQTSLLVLSGYAAFLAGGGFTKSLEVHLAVLGLSYLAIAAVTAINMYFDRDIDALMPRTQGRPLPAGLVRPEAVLGLSLAVLAATLAASYLFINTYFAIAVFIGFFFDIVAYTLLLKRRTPLSILAGAVAGGAPALGGWAAATGQIDVNALLFSLLVVSWVPPHIWFLASYYREDYMRANVPMLPVVTDNVMTGVGIGMGALMMGYSVLGLYAAGGIGPATALYGLAAATHIFMLAVMLSVIPRDNKALAKEFSRRAFRIVNMHLGMFYLVLIIEALLRAR